MKYLYILLFCLLAACTMPVESEDRGVDNTIDLNDQKSTLIKVYVEDSLSEEKQLALAGAFNRWSVKTECRVRFDIIFAPKEALKENPHINHTYYFFNRSPADPKFSGYCVWAEGAIIEIKPDLGLEIFVPVALHEIGHALGLQHYDGKYSSIMESALKNGRDISCYDLQTFCGKWNCDIECELELIQQ